MSKIYRCECGKEFNNSQSINGHKSHCIIHLKNIKRLNIRKNVDCENKSKISKSMFEFQLKKKEYANLVWTEQKNVCEHCGKVMLVKYGSGRFCSRKCANTRTHTEETKQKMSKASIKNKAYLNFTDYTGGRKENRCNRSKREKEIARYFIEKYPDEQFTYGGFGKVDGAMLTVDLYSRKLKVILEYDGIWHFKDIKNQLKSKQEKDIKLLMWVINSDYRLIRIDENEKLSLNEIDNLVFKRTDKIILAGNRYNYLNKFITLKK